MVAAFVPVDMVIPGYDPDDLEDALETQLNREGKGEYLTEEEQRRFESGESLVDLLDEEDIRRLLESEPGNQTTGST